VPTTLEAVSGISDPRTIIGFVFVAALISRLADLAIEDQCADRIWAGGSPRALPTALTPLAEIANDHRMLFHRPVAGRDVTRACAVRNFSPAMM
jgi:hypothetical protein